MRGAERNLVIIIALAILIAILGVYGYYLAH